MSSAIVQPFVNETSPEAALLFSTARVRMTTEMADRVRAAVRREVDWIRLIQMALQHETSALLCRNLQCVCPDGLPPGVLEPLAARCRLQTAEARSRAEELVRILAAFEQQGIFAVAYKGPVLAQMLYGDISLREYSRRSDLDIMVHARDAVRAQDVILKQGYRLLFRKRPVLAEEGTEYVRTRRELHFRRERGGPRMLELHWRFMLPAARVRGDPERFLDRHQMISLAGGMVRSLALEDYLLVLCLHATKHNWRKLKLICDIAEILQSSDVDWAYVLRVAGKLGLRRMLATGLLLAEDPLETVVPAALTKRLKIDRAARALAIERRQALLQEPDESWLEPADYELLLRYRERLRDRANMFFAKWLLPKFIPNERDRRFIAIPKSLSALYYFVRPIRLTWKTVTDKQAWRKN